jgi:hypothetical protein
VFAGKAWGVSVHSHVLAASAVSVASAWATLATVPAGEVWILKHTVLLNVGAALANVTLRVNDLLGPYCMAIYNEPIAANADLQWSGWVVAEAGHQLQLYSNVVPVVVWVSGAKLS